MLEFFLKGGALMYPLLLCSILTVACGMERADLSLFATVKNIADKSYIVFGPAAFCRAPSG